MKAYRIGMIPDDGIVADTYQEDTAWAS